MQMKPTSLALAACLLASCGKTQTKDKADGTSSQEPRIETRAEAPRTAENPPPARSESAGDGGIVPPAKYPDDATMIRPVGTTPDDASWEALTPEQKIEKFKSNGIARMPRHVSEPILAEATRAAAPEDQFHIITEQSTAWHKINGFMEDIGGIPDHMKTALLERLSKKHGSSWKDMIPELDEQLAASVKVDELRMKGIPGMSEDESHELFIKAIEKYGPDYKAILATANQSAKK
jgi:hypothetical protein